MTRRKRSRAARPPVLDRAERVVAAAPAKERPETWAWFAFAVTLAFLAWIAYLGARPGGRWPPVLFSVGPIVLTLAALAVLLFAIVWGATHRPLLQRRRIFPFLCLAAVIGAPQFPFPYPSSREEHPSRVCFRLPFEAGGEGEWTVLWGGPSLEENRLAAYFPDRRFGLDLVVTRDGRSHAGDARDPASYFVFDRKVLAPADGTVVGALDGEPDGPIWSRSRAEPFGNHVVIEVGEREYVFLAHLRSGSILVAPGDRVRAGEGIGRVGSSGWSTVTPEPHLAIHLQDTPTARAGEAVPASFCDYLANGALVERGSPRGGVDRERRFQGERLQARPRENR